jgi:hypothetical protein
MLPYQWYVVFIEVYEEKPASYRCVDGKEDITQSLLRSFQYSSKLHQTH